MTIPRIRKPDLTAASSEQRHPGLGFPEPTTPGVVYNPHVDERAAYHAQRSHEYLNAGSGKSQHESQRYLMPQGGQVQCTHRRQPGL